MRLRSLIITLALAGGLASAGVAGWREGSARYVAPGPLAEARAVVVAHGTPVEVAASLQASGLVADVTEFRIAEALTAFRGPVRAGEFAFPAAASLKDVLSVLRTARPVQHRLTIPEGLTAAQVSLLVDRAEALSGDPPVPAEGEVLPESYAYEYGMPRTAMVERAHQAMEHALARTWNERAENLPLASAEDMLILASIVERETARPEERARIAGVLLNRLKRGMKLQSDPTVIYAASGGTVTGGRTVSRADLDRDNPYNTYRITGLPPGPIGSPGIASLRAVARPAATDELYFVADGQGGHVFSRTLDEHNQNVARWLASQGQAAPVIRR